jgi:lipoteichoic acid synthase
LAKDRNQTVAFRNGNFVSPKYTKIGGTVYDTQTGKVLKLTAAQKKVVAQMQNHVTTELSLSDRVIYGDLLRFYKPKGFKKVDKTDFTYKYKPAMEKLAEAEKTEKTSALVKNHNKTTTYKTDAPELK